MSFIDDIRIKAQKISNKNKHHYIGAEHIFLALLEMDEGIVRRYVYRNNLTVDNVYKRVTQRISQSAVAGAEKYNGDETPRARKIFQLATRIASESHDNRDVSEQDLVLSFLAVDGGLLHETLSAMGLDRGDFSNFAKRSPIQSGYLSSRIEIVFAPDLPVDDQRLITKGHEDILHRMFKNYSSIHVQRVMGGGYTNALILMVIPYRVDGGRDASVVVKIDQQDNILDEFNQYTRFVKSTLPPFTARVEENPTIVNGKRLAGLKYTLIAGGIGEPPLDLREVIDTWTGEDLANWLLTAFYPSFGEHWWKQSDPYPFITWHEYDYLLPPLLVLDHIDNDAIPPRPIYLDETYNPEQIDKLDLDDIVVVEGFVIRKIKEKADKDHDADIIQLANSNRGNTEMTLKVEIRRINAEEALFHRNEEVPLIAGRVHKTRDDTLREAVRWLDPDFDMNANHIPYSVDKTLKVPNPLTAYKDVLQTSVYGRRSIMHGDMHLGNIMVGPSKMPVLIDFSRARKGHTVLDWVMLETSILCHAVMPRAGETWEDVRRVVEYLKYLGENDLTLPETNTALARAFTPIIAVRKIAQECLFKPDRWNEYYVALAINALRAICWTDTVSLGSRRLMYLTAGLAIQQTRETHTPSRADDVKDTRSPDDTTRIRSVEDPRKTHTEMDGLSLTGFTDDPADEENGGGFVSPPPTDH